jgi:23S rRNA pseudouridine2605 synthase
LIPVFLGGAMEEKLERLQKVMASLGVASRRECEKIILAGRVKVNGKVVTELGVKVGPKAFITVDGKGLKTVGYKYVLLYKPSGVITSMKDPQGRKTVADMIADIPERLFPVGRLDYSTEGLILLTNDGDLMQRITHPSHEVVKTYEVTVAGLAPDEKLDILRLGVPLDDGLTAPAVVDLRSRNKTTSTTEFNISIHEGRNRQIRRMCDFIGYPVRHLRRISVANLTLDGLKRGQYRELTAEELEALEKIVGKHE